MLGTLDGLNDAETSAQFATLKCGTEVTRSQVEDFLEKLQALLLLDTPLSWHRLQASSKHKARLLNNLLSVKVYSFNPDKLLSRMERKLRFCFGQPFSGLVAVSLIAAIIVSVLNWQDIFLSWKALFTLYSIPLILIVAFAVMTIHEFAHGLALKHYGGRVEAMGLMFLYFIPAFYCNVSDAWLLEKRQRIRVTFAGGYIQLFVWALATVAWRLLAPETLASRICLITIAFSGIQTLFNFNPLIRLDGYYLLRDYLEVPNLRSKAFAYLSRHFRVLLLGSEGRRPSAPPDRRERRIFFWYGTTAFLFSGGLLLFMSGRVAAWVVREYQIWGVILISVIFLMAMPAAGKHNAIDQERLLGGVVALFKKTPHLLIAAAILVGGCFLPWELKISGDFTILPNTRVLVSPQVEGTLKVIHVDEGDEVRQGEILAEIENLELSNTYEETRGELASKRASLDLLLAGTRPEEIENARRQVATKKAELLNVTRIEQERRVLLDTVAKREAELQNARNNYDRSMKLLAEGLIAKNEADRVQTEFEVQQK
ncbi:MAG: hypothetical protein ACWGQW_18015, partial [bacterium]